MFPARLSTLAVTFGRCDVCCPGENPQDEDTARHSPRRFWMCCP